MIATCENGNRHNISPCLHIALPRTVSFLPYLLWLYALVLKYPQDTSKSLILCLLLLAVSHRSTITRVLPFWRMGTPFRPIFSRISTTIRFGLILPYPSRRASLFIHFWCFPRHEEGERNPEACDCQCCTDGCTSLFFDFCFCPCILGLGLEFGTDF